jgi:drug/metabolite transporter (DMT)-like permease
VTARRPPLDAAILVPFAVFTLIWGSTWIVIRDQLGPNGIQVVSPHWSVTYRFVIAAAAMMLLAKIQGQSLRLNRDGLIAALVIGATQFCLNFNSVYLAERHITSGMVATFFALLLIQNAILARLFLGHRVHARFMVGSAVAVLGIALLFAHEFRLRPVGSSEVIVGLVLTLVGMLGASAANVYQAMDRARRHPLTALLAWSMAIGALLDAAIAITVAGAPTFDPRPSYLAGLLYLALAASALAFSLYFPVVRKIGPARAAYSSVMVPIIAMVLSTLFEGYRWSPLAALGGALAFGGMLIAMTDRTSPVPAPDAA